MNKTIRLPIRLRTLALAAALACSAAATQAHHAFAAEYDGKKPVIVKGAITQIEWSNPHAYIHLDVRDEAGHIIPMMIEGHPPNTLRRTGWLRDVMKVQDEIEVSGWASKDGSKRMAGREVTLPGGRKLFWGPPSQ